MSVQPETNNYEAGIYQLQTTDPVQGGLDGLSNLPLLQLANRTTWLKSRVDNILSGAITLPGYALLNNPVFTGDPRAPTAAAGDSDTSLATTEFVQNRVGGVSTVSVAGSGNIALTAAQAGAGILVLTGALTGARTVIVPTAPTARWIVRNATTGAHTLTVRTASGTGIVVSQGHTRGLFCDGTNVLDARTDFADIALTGNPTAPTPAADTNTTQLATTAFVLGQAGAATPLVDGTAAPGTSPRYARQDHVHPTDTSRAPLASPAFTGSPTAPTPAQFDNDTSLATTAFVRTNGANMNGFASYTGNVTLQPTDVGRPIQIFGSGTFTVTMPLASQCPSGSIVTLIVSDNAIVNLATQAGNSFVFGVPPPLRVGDSILLVSNGTDTWWPYSGSAALPQAGVFGSSRAPNGWQRLPSGVIIQWGTIAVDAGSSATVTLPISMPNGIAQVAFGPQSTTNSTTPIAAAWQSINQSSFTLRNASTITASISWVAIGY